MSNALNDAVRHEIIPYNPAHTAQAPKVKKYVGTFLNSKQLQELIGLFKNSPLEAPISLIATYGLRRSGALGLCWLGEQSVYRG